MYLLNKTLLEKKEKRQIGIYTKTLLHLERRLEPPVGFEPTTIRLQGGRSTS